MRKLTRRPLSPKTLATLEARTERVRAAAEEARAAEVERLWNMKAGAAFDEIRAALEAMASGRERCMYCEDNKGTDIEHFRPKRHYPEYAFEWNNYLLACSHCNSNEKRDQFPLDEHGRPLLIDPTSEDPDEHLRLIPSSGKLQGRTPKGTESIRVFGLSRPDLERGREDAWNTLVLALIPYYALARHQGANQTTQKLLNCICRGQFSSVLWYLLRVSRSPLAATALREYPGCLAALREFGDELARAAGFAQ
jgi:uncharacterized protein (TIGR02646 family)